MTGCTQNILQIIWLVPHTRYWWVCSFFSTWLKFIWFKFLALRWNPKVVSHSASILSYTPMTPNHLFVKDLHLIKIILFFMCACTDLNLMLEGKGFLSSLNSMCLFLSSTNFLQFPKSIMYILSAFYLSPTKKFYGQISLYVRFFECTH